MINNLGKMKDDEWLEADGLDSFLAVRKSKKSAHPLVQERHPSRCETGEKP